MSENHFKAREKKQPAQEQPVIEQQAPRKVDVICTPTGDGADYAVPQTPAGVEFLSQFYYQPANYAEHYKTLLYPLEITLGMQAHFRAIVAATPSVNVVVNQ
jgi:hypothetical protein